MEADLLQPRGFCAGVERAIETVRQALDNYGAPVYILHEIVHNQHVLEELRQEGAVFVEELQDIPPGSVVIFSAHGVAKSREQEAVARGLRVIDAVCPLVQKVHRQVEAYARNGCEVILIGHAGHVEVAGTLGRYQAHGQGGIYLVQNESEAQQIEVNDPTCLAYVTQTTLSVHDTRRIIDILRGRFPEIVGPATEDICYATQNRQNAVLQTADRIDLLLVVGAINSSNSNRLREVGEQQGIEAYLIPTADDLNADWLAGKRRVGITAGASAPEVIVQEVLKKLKEFGLESIREFDGPPENVQFSLPKSVYHNDVAPTGRLAHSQQT